MSKRLPKASEVRNGAPCVIGGYAVKHSRLAGDRSPWKVFSPDGENIDERPSYRGALASARACSGMEPLWQGILAAYRVRSPTMLLAASATFRYALFRPRTKRR